MPITIIVVLFLHVLTRAPAASKSTRSEASVRAEWRERFSQKQLAGLKALGLSPQALAREEKLLRGGISAATIRDLTGTPPHVV